MKAQVAPAQNQHSVAFGPSWPFPSSLQEGFVGLEQHGPGRMCRVRAVRAHLQQSLEQGRHRDWLPHFTSSIIM